MMQKLFGSRKAREKWDAGLLWFRLRYLETEGPTRCINLLSRPQACGRVALYYRPGKAVSQLYLGVPETHVRLLGRMVADFGFSLKPKPPEVTIPAPRRMTAHPAPKKAQGDLPWDKQFVAHITNEFVFVSLVGGENKSGRGRAPGTYLPQPPSAESGRGPAAWRLPGAPLPGLTAHPSWNGQQPPMHLVATEPDPRRWLLGRSQAGIPLHISGRVNIYGRQEAVADWLVHQVTQMITLDHANLVIIDGAGDLAPRLKRKAAVTRLLGEQLAYVDIDGTSLANGFNPLAAVPGEVEAEMVQRWQRWFQGMNVHPQGIQLLTQAQQDGVGDIPALRKWLKQVERQGQYTAVSSLGMALNRLTASRTLREWLEWPANRYEILPEGALFFACQGTGWDRQQLLRAVLLGAMQVAGVRLIVHGFPWQVEERLISKLPAQLVLSNGPFLAGAHLLLVHCSAAAAEILGDRFLASNPVQKENIQLLHHGEGVIVTEAGSVFSSWLLSDSENIRTTC